MFIRVLDFETTHETPDEGGVCEIGWCDLHVDQVDLLGAPISWRVGEPHAQLTHPGVPIPPITAAIHHIVDEDVAGAQPWKEALGRVLVEPSHDGAWVKPDEKPVACAAHSSKFELLWIIRVLNAPPMMLCTYKLALRLWTEAPSHSNQSLRYWRKPRGLIRDMAMPAHRAGPDAYVTAHHLRDLLEEAASKDAGNLLERAAKISEQPALQVTCHIGDWRGKKWADVDDGFMEWILKKDFDEDVVHTCKYWLKRRGDEERAAAEGGAAP